ncbi:MAG: TonB-dependent receptor plug domain-containing protein [Chlorobiales bacterium]|nr:TonB-dependent receptor plug domain-containing protein [Chlorobiales bacterium]
MKPIKLLTNTILPLGLLLVTLAFPSAAVARGAETDEGGAASADTSASSVRVAETKEIVVTAHPDEALASKRLKSGDAALLLSGTPGVSFYNAGGISSLPVIHGLADDRINVVIDGMCFSSACANHMNPALSYVAPASVSSIGVKAGVTPVSYGGDNIAGTILVESDQPIFANPSEGLKAGGSASAFYRSINGSLGAALSGSIANSNLSLGLTGSFDNANDYKDGHGDKVTSTYYKVRNLGATLATKLDSSNLVMVKVGHQSVPEQGFINQWMDMVDNNASFINAGYIGGFAWGKLDAKAYWQNTFHQMDSGKDKLKLNLSMPYMPMKTRGIDIGYKLKTEIPFGEENLLRLGNEFHSFTLDDWWPPVAGAMMMSPNTFQSINDGHRDRYALFAEWEAKWLDKELTTLIGVRHEWVRMNTGDVQGYNTGMMYGPDAAAFNALEHAKNDNNLDVTAITRFEPNETSSYELGFARKTRSPNLYERYAWAKMTMAAGMINWFGDGNFYVGNLDLKPEAAHTLSISADWHDSEREDWEVKVTPYFTYVKDYIGVNVIKVNSYVGTTVTNYFNTLQFANHDARMYGIDLSGKLGLWDNSSYGYWQLKGSIAYVYGKDLSTGHSLYHMMPLNAYLVLQQDLDGWSNAVELQLVGKKSDVEPMRYEAQTAGYALVNLRTSYQWKMLRFDVGVMNLLDKFYYLPLGGINYDKNLLDKRKGIIESVPGQGRSFNVSVTVTL